MQDDVTTPSAAAEAVARLRAAIEAEDLYDDLFDTADALVRSQIKKGQLKPPEDQKDFVLDLVGEALETAHRIAHKYNPKRTALPWLIGIVKKKLLARSRDRRRCREAPILDTKLATNSDGQATEEDLFALLENNDERVRNETRLVWEKLRLQLSERHADLLHRRYIDDMSVEDLAKMYGISHDNVHTRLARARNAARKILV